jgi:RNA recognition motif-containing protein
VPVRLFIGNLPYTATDDDLRAYFAQVAEPTQVVRPLDRETGRARGFAFVEYTERSDAEEAIKRFDGQLFMGRPIAVSEARAREAGGPPPRPGGGYAPRAPGGGFAPRPGGGEGFSRPPSGGYRGGDAPPDVPASRARNFGPPAPPKKKGGKGGFVKKEDKPRGPIPTKHTGRMYALEEDEDEAVDELPDFMKPETDAGPDETGADEGPDEAGPDEVASDAGVDDDEKE